jgi:hypothetical protein
MLMEPSGTEWICPSGHGTLFTAAGPVPDEQWLGGALDLAAGAGSPK